MEEKIIIETKSWEAPEYVHVSRNMDWIWSVGLISIVLAIITFWFHNPLFGIFLLISGALLIILTLRKPNIIKFEINSDEIKTGNKSYSIKKIKGFVIREDNPDNKLIIETDKNLLPIHTIPLPKAITKEVETELKKILPILDIHEPQTIQFMEKIGF